MATLAVFGPAAAWAQPEGTATAESRPARRDPAQLLATLLDGAEGARSRESAATGLLCDESGAARAFVRGVLEPGYADQGAQAVLLRAIARQAAANPLLLEGLCGVLKAGTENATLAALATGSIRTPDAARALINTAQEEKANPAVREACTAALGRMTGRCEIGSDARQWAAWFSPIEFLPEPEWRRVLCDGLARRADELAEQNDSATSRLVEIKRRELLEAEPEGRSGLLAALLADDLPALRRLGIEGVKRELANARVLDSSVTETAVEMLFDKSPAFRAAAAGLLTALAPPQAAQVIADALAAETDPVAADALLAAAARWPSVQMRPAVLSWLEHPARARTGVGGGGGAIEAGAALLKAGMLPDARDRARIVATLRTVDPFSLSPAGVWLITHAGNDEDRARVVTWLKADVPAMRRAAAEALVDDPAGLDAIMATARSDPQIGPVAARAVAAHRPTAAALKDLASLSFATPDARAAALVVASARMSVTELVAAAPEIDPATAREEVLVRLLTIAADAPQTGPDPALVRGVVLLCRTRLELGQPAGALLAIETLDPLVRPAERQPLDSLRVVSLLWLNRIDDARVFTVPASAWLDGLERAVTLPHAKAVASALEARFEGKLSGDERDRLKRLTMRLALVDEGGDG